MTATVDSNGSAAPHTRAHGKSRPLVIENNYWGIKATGTKEQLVSADLCTPANFPEGRKRIAWGESLGRKWSLNLQRGGIWVFRADETKDGRLRREEILSTTKKRESLEGSLRLNAKFIDEAKEKLSWSDELMAQAFRSDIMEKLGSFEKVSEFMREQLSELDGAGVARSPEASVLSLAYSSGSLS